MTLCDPAITTRLPIWRILVYDFYTQPKSTGFELFYGLELYRTECSYATTEE